MSSLLDLPVELLILILERVGGRELRRGKGSARLTLCRAWYAAALPIYRSGFGTSNVQLYGHDVQKIRGRFGYPGLRPLMHKNTRYLRIHLLGHPWDVATAQADQDGEYTTWNTLPSAMDGDHSLISTALKDWRDAELKPCLDELFGDLRNFEALEHVVVEARSEAVDERDRIPHRNYIHANTISRLALNLPYTQDLVSFTLDTYGTDLMVTGNVCDMLANVLPRVKNVRLRMARICPAILNFKPMRVDDVKLENLTLKLYAPASIVSDGHGSTTCSDLLRQHAQPSDIMAQASRVFIARIDIMSIERGPKLRFRISHSPITFPCVHVIDCRSMRQYRLWDRWYAYESDGKPCWFEMEEGDMLVDCGPYSYIR